MRAGKGEEIMFYTMGTVHKQEGQSEAEVMMTGLVDTLPSIVATSLIEGTVVTAAFVHVVGS